MVSVRDSPVHQRSPVPPKKIKRCLSSSYYAVPEKSTVVTPSSKEISKILDVVTRLENKVDRLTDLLTENSQMTEGVTENSESFETREFHQTIHEEIEQRTQESQPKFQPFEVEESQLAISSEQVVQLRQQASSATSFAVNLVKSMFERHELVGRNVSGVRGKQPLDAKKIEKIKELVRQFYPAPLAEAAETWRNCRKAIDSHLRKTQNAPKPSSTSSNS